MASTERFGYEWNKYSYLDPNYENQIKNWISPLRPRDFKNKSVLDAGCGMGRNSYWALKWGAQKLTAFDYDKRSVSATKKNLAKFKNTDISFQNINKINWENKFDIAFSIGVIHHLNNPETAIQNLYRAIKPGGIFLMWVYSFEGNKWIPKYIDPIRIHLTSKLPLPIVHLIAYLPSVPLWLFIKIYQGENAYFKQLSTFKFKHLHSIVFDQLIPVVANYWKKDEIDSMLKKINITNYTINRPPNECGWTIIIKK